MAHQANKVFAEESKCKGDASDKTVVAVTSSRQSAPVPRAIYTQSSGPKQVSASQASSPAAASAVDGGGGPGGGSGGDAACDFPENTSQAATGKQEAAESLETPRYATEVRFRCSKSQRIHKH